MLLFPNFSDFFLLNQSCQTFYKWRVSGILYQQVTGQGAQSACVKWGVDLGEDSLSLSS